MGVLCCHQKLVGLIWFLKLWAAKYHENYSFVIYISVLKRFLLQMNLILPEKQRTGNSMTGRDIDVWSPY